MLIIERNGEGFKIRRRDGLGKRLPVIRARDAVEAGNFVIHYYSDEKHDSGRCAACREIAKGER
jgi:hypothetical protein